MNPTLKRYLVSSAVTFFSAMGLVLLANIDSITLESFKDGSLVGLGFMAVRAGVKGILELYLNK